MNKDINFDVQKLAIYLLSGGVLLCISVFLYDISSSDSDTSTGRLYGTVGLLLLAPLFVLSSQRRKTDKKDAAANLGLIVGAVGTGLAVVAVLLVLLVAILVVWGITHLQVNK